VVLGGSTAQHSIHLIVSSSSLQTNRIRPGVRMTRGRRRGRTIRKGRRRRRHGRRRS